MIQRTLSDMRAARLRMAGAFLWRHNGVVALILFAAVGLAVLDDYGISLDEWLERNLGVQTLAYILGDAEALPADHNRYYGVAFALPLTVIERVLGLEHTRDIYLTRHLLTHAFHLAGGMFAWLLARRMFGSRALAFVAMLIFLLHPRIYAHSFFNTKDAPFAAMFMISLYAIHRAFGKNTPGAFACAGVAVALLVNTRAMGAALFPAVIVMQIYDAIAALWAGRGAKRAALCIAAFAISAPATLFAAWPVMWSDPLAPLAAFGELSDHPNQLFVLFQGEMIHNTELPPEYLPVWMAITTPPMILALAAIGAAAALWAGARRPLDALGNTETRFRLLLVASAVLTLAAVARFSPHLVNGWRHFFFLHAPIALLAACGVWALASAAGALMGWARELVGERLSAARALSPALARAAVYGIALLGIGAIVGEMAAIHPHQIVYFNSFVDRQTPEYLRTQYEMDYWGTSQWEGLRRLLERYPESEPSALSDKSRLLLSEREKGALRDGGGYRTDPDFWALNHTPSQAAFAPYIYTRRVYNNAIMSVAAINLDMTDAETAAPYLRLYQDAKSGAFGEPIGRADFDIWLDDDDNALIYARDDCETHESADFNFVVNIAPLFHDDPQPFAWDYGPEYFGESFRFPKRGVRFGGKCLMKFPLPDFPIRAVQAGAWIGEGMAVWGEKMIAPDGEALAWHRNEYARVSEREPEIRSGFDAYLDGGDLVLLKAPCAESDVGGRFGVGVWASDARDLPTERRALGYESLNFSFAPRGSVFDGKCMAWRELPDYHISAIELGQWGAEVESSWKARLIRAADGTLTDERLEMHRRADDGEMGAPLIKAPYDIYLDDDALVYVKEPCAQEDTLGRFLVSVYPQDADDVSALQKAKGLAHDSLNFSFADRGIEIGEGRCMALVNLPDYRINSMELGQWGADVIESWEVRLIRADDGALTDERLEMYRRAASGEMGAPLIAAPFNIYLDDGALVYTKEPCAQGDTRGRFLVNVYPQDADDVSDAQKAKGQTHDSLNFNFADNGIEVGGGRCMALVALPDYAISAIDLGQWGADVERWDARLSRAADGTMSAESAPAPKPAAADDMGEALVRSVFDVYLDDGALVYAKEPCSEDDKLGNFLINAYPKDADDVSASQKAKGLAHDNLNFVFAEREIGAAGDKCMARVALPDYAIDRLDLGQWIPGGETRWVETAAMPAR